eukprot:m.307903 g.307903  ORF g.307903 m.307903 type:complete len:216 (-) comp19630_c0_seq6:103-750(-)
MKRGGEPLWPDASGTTALDYASDRGHAGCGEVMLREYQVKPQHRPCSVIEATKVLENPIDVSASAPSDAVREVFQLLTVGSYLGKFTRDAKGPSHMRYFWVDLYSGELCWTKTPADFASDPEAISCVEVVSVQPGASPAVLARSDYDARGAHMYSFTVTTDARQLDLVAPSETMLRLWLEGLRCLMRFGQDLLTAPPNATKTLADRNADVEGVDV